MAQRDRSQGFGFMYVNIAKLLEEKKDAPKNEEAPVMTDNVRTANFNKDVVKTKPAVTPLEKQVTAERATAISQIRENLDRLQSLHHKLHAMLDELNRVTDSTDKRRKSE